MEKIVCTNRKVRMYYTILETLEAGLVLKGTEVKSLREGRVNINDAYAAFKGKEIYLINSHISEYSHGNIYNHDPMRDRKLLLTKQEIKRFIGKVKERGQTIVPLKIYFKNGKAKIEIALAKGKKIYDRREELKKRAQQREMERAMKVRRK